MIRKLKSRKGVIGMVSFVIGFGVMLLMVIFGSYFVVDEEMSTNLEVQISSEGTYVQNILTANAIHKSDRVSLQSRMHKYYSGGSKSSIETSIEDEANNLLNNSYDRYDFDIADTDIGVNQSAPPGLFTFHVSTPEGEKEVELSVDEQGGFEYEPIIGGLN